MSAPHHNRLVVLAADIRAAHAIVRASAEVMADRALAAGAWLNEAKKALPHGKWEPWLNDHVGMSTRTARRYMQIDRSGLKTATVADLGIRGASEAISRKIIRPRNLADDPDYQDWAAEMTRMLDLAPSRKALERFWQAARLAE